MGLQELVVLVWLGFAVAVAVNILIVINIKK